VAWVNHGENKITRATGWDGYGALYATPLAQPATEESSETQTASAYVKTYHGGKPWPLQPAPVQPVYKDSTPHLHVGDSAFESWFSEYNPAGKGDKQRARDAYAAGMGDQLVAPAAQPAPVQRQYYYRQAGCPAKTSDDADCICWHNEGEGPLSKPPYDQYMTWRIHQPAQPAPTVQEPVALIRTWHKNGDQHAELVDWGTALQFLPDGEHCLYTTPPAQPAPVPLTNTEFCEQWFKQTGRIMGTDKQLLLQAKRVTEAAHGITAAPEKGQP
jgi:hypothetical protein